MENKIYIIGIGPGSSEYLTKKDCRYSKNQRLYCWKYKSNRFI